MRDVEKELRKRMAHGRQALISKEGYCCCYVVGPRESGPVKVGYAKDIIARLAGLQCGNWNKIWVFELMWLAGPPLAQRVEAGALLKLRQERKHVLGEWFDVGADEAFQALINTAAELNIPWFDEEHRRKLADSLHDWQMRKLAGVYRK